MMGRWVSYGFGALSIFLFAQLTAPSVYGQFTFLSSLFDIFIIVTLPGMSAALVRAVSRGYEGTVHVVSRKRFIGALAGSVILLGCFGYYALVQKNPALAVGTLVAAVVFPFHYSLINYESVLIGKQAFPAYTAYTTASTVTGSIAIMGTLLLTKSFVVPFIAKTVLACVFAGWAYGRVTKGLKPDVDPDAISYGMRLTSLNVISILASKGELLIIPLFFSFDSLAFFYVAERAASEFKFMWTTVSNQMLTKLAPLSIAEAFKKAVYRLPTVLVVFALMASLAGLSASILFPLLLTERYLPAIALTQMMLLASVLSLTGAYFETYLISQKLITQLVLLRFVFPVSYLVLLPLLAYWQGMMGIVYAKMVAGATYSASAALLAYRERSR